MVKNILSKLKSVFNTGSSKQPSKQPSKQLLPPETDGEGGHLCMINYHFEDEDYDDLLTTVTSRKPTIDEAVKLVEKRNKSLIDTGVRTGEIFITNILYSDKGDL